MRAIHIHPTAIIDEGAQIGSETKIWHFSHIMSGAIIGEKCNIGQNVFIGNNVKIGSNVKIQNNVSIYDGVVLEDNVFVGPSVVFTNVMNPRSSINRKTEFRNTLIRQGTTLGANSTIVCGIEVGSYAFIGAGSVLTHDVGSYHLQYGNPAKQHGWISAAGHKLEFDLTGIAVCPQSGERYLLSAHQVQLLPDLS